MSATPIFAEKSIYRVDRADRIAARALKRHREAAGLNPHELARLSGVKIRDLVQYESGQHQVPMSVLFTVAPLLGMDIDAVLHDVMYNDAVSDTEDSAEAAL